MRSPTRRPNRFCVWTRNRFSFTPKQVPAVRPAPDTSPKAITSTSGGTANIFVAVEPKGGRHFARATPNRFAFQFALAVKNIVSAYPFARKIPLVMDNLTIHCRKPLTDHLGEDEGTYL